MTDVDSGESVSIPTEDISEPMFHQGRGGLRHRVHPGNDHFVQNDRIERPQGGGGGSGSGQGQASQDGEGQDEFVFQISKDEYLDLLFEDLALPNLKQNQQRQLTEYKTHRAGYTLSLIHILTFARWLRPVREDMPQMGITVTATNFYALHSM